MEALYVLFGAVKEMAWQATPVILLVLLARAVLERGIKKTYYFIWGIVALRLICPVFPTSDISVFRYAEYPLQFLVQLQADETAAGSQFADQTWNGNIGAVLKTAEIVAGEDRSTGTGIATNAFFAENPLSETCMIIWLAGILVMLFYAVISGIILKRRLRYATYLRENIFECDVVHSPFVFGIMKPKIYLPYHLGEQELSYILAHERCHIRRRDYLTKWLAFFLLAVYWFHPLVWAAYILLNRDMEVSCDAYVLKNCTLPERKAYGELLLRFSCDGKTHLVSEIGFGERSMKKRMKHILSGKKTTVGASMIAVIFLVVLTISCLTDKGIGEQGGLTAAQALYEASNSYIGDASANARLLETIGTCVGEPGQEYTMELQTESAPYALTLHLKESPNPDEMCKAAILFLTLTENCEQVAWEYVPEEEENMKYVQVFYPEKEVLSATEEPTGKLHCYLKLSDAEELLGVEDIKAYAASPKKIEELLGMLDTQQNQSFFAYRVRYDDQQVSDMFVTSNFYH